MRRMDIKTIETIATSVIVLTLAGLAAFLFWIKTTYGMAALVNASVGITLACFAIGAVFDLRQRR